MTASSFLPPRTPPISSISARSVVPIGRSMQRGRSTRSAAAVELGAGALRIRGELLEPRRAVRDDARHARERLDVVDGGGPAPQARGRGIRAAWRAGPRRLALERVEERGFFAADVAAAAPVDVDVERVARVRDCSRPAGSPRRASSIACSSWSRLPEVLAADEDESVGHPHRVAGDGHALDQDVRVALDQHPILEGAGLHLVGVAHQVLGPAVALLAGRHERPLEPRGESRAAAPAQAGILDDPDQIRGLHVLERAPEAAIAAGRLGTRRGRPAAPLRPLALSRTSVILDPLDQGLDLLALDAAGAVDGLAGEQARRPLAVAEADDRQQAVSSPSAVTSPGSTPSTAAELLDQPPRRRAARTRCCRTRRFACAPRARAAAGCRTSRPRRPRAGVRSHSRRGEPASPRRRSSRVLLLKRPQHVDDLLALERLGVGTQDLELGRAGSGRLDAAPAAAVPALDSVTCRCLRARSRCRRS